jgi:hypothetical protein
MPEHSRFEELCALALVGQISAADSAELEAHLKLCDTCRKAQADFVEIGSWWLSPSPEPDLSHEIGSTLSQRILCKMQAAGARFSKPVVKEVGGRSPGFKILALSRLAAPAYAAAGLALLAAGAMLGIGVAAHRSSPAPQKATVLTPAPADVSALPRTPPNSPTDAELIAARRSQEEGALKLAAAKAELSRAQARLEEAERRLAAFEDSSRRDTAEIASLRSAADQARAEAVEAQAHLAKLKDVQATRDADLVAVQYRAREAEEQLAEQVAALDRERKLLGVGREIRDIIGARNLHIVDVADVGSGGVKKPFGRVFYTEGKSLIFYAYDLANPKGKQAFYAWGHREGYPNSTRMLGLLYNDDQAQKRWAFKFDDPKVLAEIDSVFVTLEPNDKPGDIPLGKKLLKAYLGTPANHP